jgi:hypothetical protein
LQIEAVSGNGSNAKSQTSRTEIEANWKDALNFAGVLRDKIGRWEEKFAHMQKSGQRVIAWGAGGRGINFLNLVRASRFVPYIVDINPTRCGGFIPGTGQQVVAPEFLREYRPDILLLTNPTYEEEVRKKVEEMAISCEFLTAT